MQSVLRVVEYVELISTHFRCFTGTFTACHHDFAYDQVELYIDPILATPYTPWELRDHPITFWDAPNTDLFTLIVINPEDPRPLHGLTVNIVGNNFTAGQVNIHAKNKPYNLNIQSILQYNISHCW